MAVLAIMWQEMFVQNHQDEKNNFKQLINQNLVIAPKVGGLWKRKYKTKITFCNKGDAIFQHD